MVTEFQVWGHKEGKLFLHLYIGKKPISIKLGTNISCIMGIQIYLNEGPSSLQFHPQGAYAST
jgi:hypothetical protein